MGMFKNVLYNTEGLFSNVFVQRAVGNLTEALMASSYHLNQWSSLFPCLSNEKNSIYLTRPCGDSVNEIIHRNTGTDRHISQQVKKSALLSLWGLPYKQEELCCPAQHQTPRVKLSEAVPWAFVDLTVLTWLVTSVESDSCNPTDCSPPGSSVHGILQARILEWATISISRGSSQPTDQTAFPSLLLWQARSYH